MREYSSPRTTPDLDVGQTMWNVAVIACGQKHMPVAPPCDSSSITCLAHQPIGLVLLLMGMMG